MCNGKTMANPWQNRGKYFSAFIRYNKDSESHKVLATKRVFKLL